MTFQIVIAAVWFVAFVYVVASFRAAKLRDDWADDEPVYRRED